LRLAQLGAEVIALDARTPGCGANAFNLAGAPVRQVEDNIAHDSVAPLLKGVDVIFNLAGEVSHSHSMLFPERDLELNAIAHLRFLNTCALYRPGVRIVYASTRQIYGIPEALPVDERHPIGPVDFNGVHKMAGGQYHAMLTRLGRVDAIVLRLTNIYGPRMAIGLPCQGFLPVFTRRALTGTSLEVFGDGLQMRDPVFVDDACDAFLRAGEVLNPTERILNIGSPEPRSLFDIAAEFSRQGRLPPPRLLPFPPDRKPIDIGSYMTCTALAEEQLGWRSATPLAPGIAKTLDYYRAHFQHYGKGTTYCPLHHSPS
jgi:UDP-glucose 4-epimerase